MKGTFFKRGETWSFVVDVGKVNGKRKQVSKGGFKTKKLAQAKCAEIITEVEKNEYKKESNIKFAEVLNEFLAYKKLKIKTATYTNYQAIINKNLLPYLGDMPIRNITAGHVDRLYNDLNIEPSSIANTHAVLRMAFKMAIDRDYIKKDITISKPKGMKSEMQTWTTEECNEFLKFAKDKEEYIVYLLALTTGMRQEEILSLRWFSVIDNIITVGMSKTMSGKRSVVLDEQTVQELEKIKVKQCQNKELAGELYNELDYVCCDAIGNRFTATAIRYRFSALKKELGIKDIRFHDMRHTHATLLLQLNINPKIVAERLGHTDIKTTLDTYSHVLPTMQSEAVTIFGKSFHANKNANVNNTR